MPEHPHPFDIAPISKRIWEQKYRLTTPDGTPIDKSIDDTWLRISSAAATVEPHADRARWTAEFTAAMSDFGFLPGGRIIAGAGSDRSVTLFNCFVMGKVEDDLGGIFDAVKEAALTMQSGGGIGQDFSTLRPRGALVRSIGADASGPVSFMDVWDSMCRTVMSAGARRGAMMATMRCDHPDIDTFIAAKAEAARLRNFNLSVLVTDPFIEAVRNDKSWDLVFEGRVYATVSARELWERIMQATYDFAEPGVIFIDRINAMNNLSYCEDIKATNPCGEQPLPAYGACLLGSINLARFVCQPFAAAAFVDIESIARRVKTAVRLLDNMIDCSRYPLQAQQKEALAKRRMGIGITGLADSLMMCGVRYGSPEARDLAARCMQAVQIAAYEASAGIAAEKGSFPLYDAEKFLAAANVKALPPGTRALVAKHGIRNGCLTSIAPTGTISLLAGNVSSGIEPVFDFRYRRRVLGADGHASEEHVEDYAHGLFRRLRPEGSLTAAFVKAADLAPEDHLQMQAALQPHVDSSISKTINCPADIPFLLFKDVYLAAYDAGLKGCTTFRPNAVTGAVLSPSPADTVEVTTVDAGSAGHGSHDGSVVYMSKPLERTATLPGFTYKLIWPGQDNALYITINDIERGGRLSPFEIFINTKNLEHYAWTVALTRMISAIFRRGGDVTFIVDELKAIFDPQGGRWIDGRYVPSLLAAIGEVIERHMISIGFLKKHEESLARGSNRAAVVATSGSSRQKPSAPNDLGETYQHFSAAGYCPRCGHASLVRMEGCWSCTDCGYSRCD